MNTGTTIKQDNYSGMIMPKMTVKDAKDIFEKWGGSLQKPFDDLIDIKSQDKPEKPISNDNYFMALCFTNRMFSKTNKHIRMLAGKDGADFLNLLQSNFERAMERVRKNDGFVRIILVTEKIPNFLKQLKAKYPKWLEYKRAILMPGAQIEHTIICDDYMVREEEIHPPLDENTPADAIRASVYFSNSARGKMRASEFDGTWSEPEESASQ